MKVMQLAQISTSLGVKCAAAVVALTTLLIPSVVTGVETHGPSVASHNAMCVV